MKTNYPIVKIKNLNMIQNNLNQKQKQKNMINKILKKKNKLI